VEKMTSVEVKKVMKVVQMARVIHQEIIRQLFRQKVPLKKMKLEERVLCLYSK
jgi:hypothetical protein